MGSVVRAFGQKCWCFGIEGRFGKFLGFGWFFQHVFKCHGFVVCTYWVEFYFVFGEWLNVGIIIEVGTSVILCVFVF